MSIFDDPNQVFHVVINHEEQYSIWPVDRDLPLGWKATGFTAKREAALAHIEEVWTDMRPFSLREKLKEAQRHEQEAHKG